MRRDNTKLNMLLWNAVNGQRNFNILLIYQFSTKKLMFHTHFLVENRIFEMFSCNTEINKLSEGTTEFKKTRVIKIQKV